MRKMIMGILFAGVLSSGCTRTSNELQKEISTSLNESSHFKKLNRVDSDAKKLAGKKVEANFVGATVFYAVSEVAKSLDIPMDRNFIPASQEKITANFSGDFYEFIEFVYQETGVKYRFRNGILGVFNKNEVERAYRAKPCGKFPNDTINISMDGVSPIAVFKYMAENYNLNISYDFKYHVKTEEANNRRGDKEKKIALPLTSFSYKGCDRVEAISSFVKANDLRMQKKGKNNIVIYDYATAELDLPIYFNVDFTSGKGTDGIGSSSSTVSMGENFKDEFKKYIKSEATKRAEVYPSNRGYLVITDTPSSVRHIKKLLRIEKRRQKPIRLTVSIINIKLSDQIDTGVDWQRAFDNIASETGYNILTASSQYADRIEGGISIAGEKNGITNVVKALQKYGNAKIDRTFSTQTRSGMLNNFESVTDKPYMESSISSNAGGTQTNAKAESKMVGIVINILPSLSEKGEVVNLSTNIELSEWLQDTHFNINGSDYKIPEIAKNRLNVPARVHLGDTIVLTGLKLKEKTIDKEGIPLLSQLPSSLSGAFGYSGDTKRAEEYLVIVSVDSVKEY